MHINIVTLFPEFFSGPLSSALMQRARSAGILSFTLCNPRDAATDRHRSVDDRPYGGGPGMVMLPGPLAETLRALGHGPHGLPGPVNAPGPGRLLFLSPKGRPFTQALAAELAVFLSGGAEGGRAAKVPTDGGASTATGSANPEEGGASPAGGSAGTATPEDGSTSADGAADSAGSEPYLTLLCGRYEGLDARIEDLFAVEAVSVGDFVLNGGEAAALCVVEAVARLLPGFMGHEESGAEESFSTGLLEYPHYTRPEVFEGLSVPEALRSGDHGRIARWRRQAALLETLDNRPDLLSEAALTAEDRRFLRSVDLERPGRNLYCALVHYPVLDREGNSLAVSLTNLDIHDIARSSCTYGLGGYYVLTPLEDQRALLERILRHWTEGPGKRSNPDRDTALGLVRSGVGIPDAIADIATRTGQEPLVVGTSARPEGDQPPVLGFSRLAEQLRQRPVLLLFGTGHGLAPEAQALCQAFAPPLRWQGGYNHLSVRAAAAIIFDRLLGDWR